MKRELRDRWCAALRSGEYKQGEGMLHDPIRGTYCCLGVLQHIHAGGQVPERGYLTSDTLRECGLTGRMQLELSALNDDETPFGVIADYIEREVPVEDEVTP